MEKTADRFWCIQADGRNYLVRAPTQWEAIKKIDGTWTDLKYADVRVFPLLDTETP